MPKHDEQTKTTKAKTTFESVVAGPEDGKDHDSDSAIVLLDSSYSEESSSSCSGSAVAAATILAADGSASGGWRHLGRSVSDVLRIPVQVK
jgi:hypothetical protein